MLLFNNVRFSPNFILNSNSVWNDLLSPHSRKSGEKKGEGVGGGGGGGIYVVKDALIFRATLGC